MPKPRAIIPTASTPKTGYTHLGGPLAAIGSKTGATGENCGVEKVGRESEPTNPSPRLDSPMVLAAIDRMSIRPEPSVVELVDGARALLDEFGTASASRLDRENRTEFSLR
jgi:hypothetical protein